MNPSASARAVAAAVGCDALCVSTRTVQRTLNRCGLLPFRPKKSPSLTPAQSKVRLQWARSYQHWTEADWCNVIFSDECAFDLAPIRSQYVRRVKGEPITMQHTSQHRPFLQRIMVWSCMSSAGPGKLIPVTGTLNAVKYIDILSQKLLPQSAIWFPNGNFHYQQDNAPCHKALVVRHFFQDNHVQVIDWPPYSPDLNCIENLWAIVKKKLHSQHYQTKVELLNNLQQIWNSPDLHGICQRLVSSMPRRLAACIAARGGYTNY
jgi:hypothetical protein